MEIDNIESEEEFDIKINSIEIIKELEQDLKDQKINIIKSISKKLSIPISITTLPFIGLYGISKYNNWEYLPNSIFTGLTYGIIGFAIGAIYQPILKRKIDETIDLISKYSDKKLDIEHKIREYSKDIDYSK